VRTGEVSPFREIRAADLLRGVGHAVVALPAYLGAEVQADRTAIPFVVHRDAPSPPALDPAGGGAVALTLAVCWLLGLAALAPLMRDRGGEVAAEAAGRDRHGTAAGR